MKISWNKNALKIRRQRIQQSQNYIDAQCVQKMTPYVPVGRSEFKNSGRLSESAKIISPGKIVYTAPFAKSDYYSTVTHKNGGNPNAQRLWFELMKKQHGSEILRGAAKIAGGKPK